ncbi:helix-turn-helix domain-containing protein [Piscinibacter terrae]|uniref:XRE family transcriptional regulator n=1 Tax=Piscinibacter terrae TaxID=2496871 RepID=A0A3N7HUQ2_9BURK|nr:helix-turn-helix transcriptional regulator [Albitalea terrae]RQP24671.1 XRE family transcriptional regulator [Albitalea terrae]
MPAKPAALPDQQAQTLVALGERLRKARLRRQWSAQEVAKQAGITRVTLHRAEAGEPAISIGNLAKVLAVLGLDDDLNHLATDQPLRDTIPDERLPIRRTRRERRIALDSYPQLRQIAWHLDPADTLSPAEALALYERNWRHVSPDTMEPHEKALLDHLTATVGRGVLLV